MRTSEQTRRLAERVAELEQRKQDEGIFPDAILLVGVDATGAEETRAVLWVRPGWPGGSMSRAADESEADFCARVMGHAAACQSPE